MASTKITTSVITADAITGALIADDVALGGNPTTSTQSAGNDTTRVATTAFVTAAINNLIDSAPGTMNTLNEIAAAINDDANFNTTVTNLIAAKLPLAGGTMTGALAMNANAITSTGDLTLDVAGDIVLDADGGDILLRDGGTHWASVYTNGTNTYIQNMVNSGDVYLSGKDGSGNGVNALILDMSAGGQANFSSHVFAGGLVDVSSIGQLANVANDLTIYSSTSGHNGLRFHVNGILPTNNAGAIVDNDADLGDPSYRFKDGWFGGTVSAVNFKVNNGQGSDGQILTSTGSGVAWEDAPAGGLPLSGGTLTGNLALSSGSTITQTVGSSGGAYYNVTHTGNESWSWAAQSGAGSDDYLDVGISGGTRIMSWHEDGTVGIGNTSPNGWSSGYMSLQIGARGFVGAHTGSDLYIGQNAYFDSGWKYEGSVAASMTQHSGGQITHKVAAAGTADNAITWTNALHIKPTGEVGIGTASNSNGIDLHLYSTVDSRPHILLEGVQDHDTDDAPILEFYTNDSTTGGIGDSTYVGEIIFSGDEKDGNSKEIYGKVRGMALDPGSGTSNKGSVELWSQVGGTLQRVLNARQIQSSGATGAVGINEVNPTYTFDINTSGESNALRVYQGTNSKDASVVIQNAGTSSGDDSLLQLYTAGGAGDPKIRFAISGNETFEMGIDNSDSDTFKISQGSSGLGTTDLIEWTAGKKLIFLGNHQGDSVGHFIFTNEGGNDSTSTNCTLMVKNGNAQVQIMPWSTLGARVGTRGGGWNSNSNNNMYLTSNDASNIICTSSGSPTLANGTAISSDERLKKNITDIADGQLAKVNALKPRNFEWKDSRKPGTQEGFIAQEVESVMPEAVEERLSSPDPDDTSRDFEGNIKVLKHEVINARLIKAVQELSAKLEAAEARITTLEG